jgi:transposase
MKIEKQILVPDRVRRIKGSFSFIPHRFVADGFFSRLTHAELLVYFLLLMVGDRYGLSYYRQERLCSMLKMEIDDFMYARNGLIEKSLIAFDGFLFQVLSLPPKPVGKKSKPLMTFETLYIGIDVSKLKHDLALMSEHKTLLGKPFVIQENPAGYSTLMQRLAQLRQQYQPHVFYVGMEATGDYWKNLFHFFRHQPDCQVVVINPVKTKAFAKTELRRAKTDAVNAKDIARYLVEKKPPPSYFRPAILENIKDLNTQIRALKKQQTMLVNRLRVELGKVAPEIEHRFRYIQGKQILALLMQFPTAKMIQQASLDQLQQIRYGKNQWRMPTSFLLKLKRLTQDSIGYKSGMGAGWVVQSLIRTLHHYHAEIEFLTEQMTHLYENAQSPNADILSSLKGVTKESAIILDAYFGDVRRFRNQKEFVAFFGMNPVVNESGKKTTRKSSLEKKGSGFIRYQLFLIILNLIKTRQEPFYSYYQRLISAGKPKLVAMAATMRKLLVIMFQMLRNQEKFNPNKY